MKITLQRKIAVLWFALSVFNTINYVYQIIRLRGTFGSFGDSVLTTPYFSQILSYSLIENIVSISSENQYIAYKFEWYSSIFLTLFSVIIPVALFFNLRYSRKIAKVFLIVFMLLNVFAIFVKMTLFLPVANEFSTYEIMINKKMTSYICYYSVVLLIAILFFVGLFYYKSKKQNNNETIY